MKNIVTFCSILFVCLASVQAEPPSQSYEMGFKTISVLDYIQALKKAGEDIPKFPPRTGNALIVQKVKFNSRAAKAGLLFNDLIQIINGKLIRSPQEAGKILKEVTYEDELTLKVIRREDDKWKRINVTLEPNTEEEYFRSKLSRYSRLDENFYRFSMVSHKDAPFSKYSRRNIQLYFAEVDRQPPTLYLRMSLLVRTKVDLGEFVIKTDNATYRVITEKKIDKQFDKQQAVFKAKLAEAKKLEEAAEKKMIEADKKSKAADAAYLAEFKDFKVDKKRKDEKYKKLLQRRLESIKHREKLVIEYEEAAQNSLETIQNSKNILKNSLEYSRKKLKQAKQKLEQASRQANAAFNQLSEFHADLLKKGADNISQGISPSARQLATMEHTGFEGPEIRKVRINQGWRWYDAPLNKKQKHMLEDILSSSKVKIYHESDQYRGFDLTPQQLEQMKFILKVFEARGGKITD